MDSIDFSEGGVTILLPYIAGKRRRHASPVTPARFSASANRHAGEMEGLPHDLPEGRADFYRRLGEGGTKLEKSYQVSIIRLEKCKFRAFQRGNRGTPATLTDSRLSSITNNTKGQPEVHLGDNKGTSKVHPGHTNHTDT